MLLDAADHHVAVNFKQNMRRETEEDGVEEKRAARAVQNGDDPLNAFLKCIDECPLPASKANIPDGFKINTQVGCLFHDTFAIDVPDKKKRKTLFKTVARRALSESLVDHRVIGSMTFFKTL